MILKFLSKETVLVNGSSTTSGLTEPVAKENFQLVSCLKDRSLLQWELSLQQCTVAHVAAIAVLSQGSVGMAIHTEALSSLGTH